MIKKQVEQIYISPKEAGAVIGRSSCTIREWCRLEKIDDVVRTGPAHRPRYLIHEKSFLKQFEAKQVKRNEMWREPTYRVAETRG